MSQVQPQTRASEEAADQEGLGLRDYFCFGLRLHRGRFELICAGLGVRVYLCVFKVTLLHNSSEAVESTCL